MVVSPPRAKHILAGDDAPAILALFREILEAEGYRVTLSTEMLDLDRIKRAAPDLVILDYMLDDGAGSGWQLLRELRDDPATTALPVVVCTGAVHRVRENVETLRELGAGVVLKPFDIDRLLAVVDRALDGADHPGPSPSDRDDRGRAFDLLSSIAS